MIKPLLFVFMLVITGILLCGCFPSFLLDSMLGPQDSFSPSEYSGDQESYEEFAAGPADPYDYEYEALDWLSNNTNAHALAKGRFHNTDEAIDFVKALYDRDAVVVLVTGISQQADLKNTQSEPYADSLVIVLPKDIHSRTAIQTLYRKEVKLYGCNSGSQEAGIMGDMLFMSWYDDEED